MGLVLGIAWHGQRRCLFYTLFIEGFTLTTYNASRRPSCRGSRSPSCRRSGIGLGKALEATVLGHGLARAATCSPHLCRGVPFGDLQYLSTALVQVVSISLLPSVGNSARQGARGHYPQAWLGTSRGVARPPWPSYNCVGGNPATALTTRMQAVSIYRRPGTATRPGARDLFREHGLARAGRNSFLEILLAILLESGLPSGSRPDNCRTDALDTPRAAGISLHHAELPQHPIATCMGTPLAGNRRTTLAPTFAGRSHRLLGT